MKIKEIKPTFNNIVTTMDVYEEDVMSSGGLIDTKKQQGTVKEYQKVVAVGSCVRDINVGDLVCINPTRYGQKEYKEGSLKDGIISHNAVIRYNFNVIEINNVPHLFLQDRDIDFVITDFEEDPPITPTKKSDLYIPTTSIVC